MPKRHLLLLAITLLLLSIFPSDATKCNKSTLMDGEADLILKETNEVRMKVRKGEQRNGLSGKNLPAASSLPDLEWDCTLEEDAHQYMDDMCTGNNAADSKGKATIMHGDYEEFFIPGILSSYFSAADFVALTKVEGGKVVYSNEDDLKGFANLMRAEAKSIGCARYSCKDPSAPTFYAMVCFTDQLDIKENDVIYEAVSGQNRCPANAYINDSVRTAFLNKHNTLRAAVLRSQLAIGVVSNGQSGKMCSPATNMPKLVYDCELEKTAYERAKQCNNVGQPRAGIKENFFNNTRRIGGAFERIAKAVTQYWWSELNKTSGLKEPRYIYYGNQNINSFAKIASDLTTKIGCAIYNCSNVVNVVCHYESALGHGKPLYISGSKCSQCLDKCVNGLCPAKVTTSTQTAATYGPTNCTNSMLKQADVDAILDVVNGARTKVLEGGYRNGTSGKNLPAAISIPPLVWNCALEDEALRIAKEMCAGNQQPPVLANNSYTATIAGKQIRIPKVLHDSLKEAHYTDLKGIQSSNVTYNDEPHLITFANLIRATATGIGCTVHECQNFNKKNDTVYFMMCVTDQPAIKKDEVIYEAIDPKNDCPHNPYMNNSLRAVFLNKHNTQRSVLALGTASNGGTGQNCKPATNMPRLLYDCELEKTAYERARLCEHFTPNSTHVYHENYFQAKNINRKFELIVNSAVQYWWSELKRSAGINHYSNFYYTSQNVNSFAKIASDKTIKVGCGMYKCAKMVNVVCHYETSLENGRRLYAMGPKCSKCPKTCYIGLCPAVEYGVTA